MRYRITKKTGLIVFSSEVGDGPMNLPNKKNVSLYTKKIGIVTPLSQAEQIHGNKIAQAKKGIIAEGADGLFCFDDTPLSIRSADCVPVFLHDLNSGFCCALHCSRKNLIGGIISDSLKRLLGQLDVASYDLKGFVGPHIRVKNYPVFDDDADKIRQAGFGKYLDTKATRSHFDLTSCVFGELEKIGIPRDNIVDCGIDTFENKKLFSYRRDIDKKPAVFITICFKNYAG